MITVGVSSWAPAAILVALALSGCGAPGVRSIVVNQQVTVDLVNPSAAPEMAAIDPTDPRIAKDGRAIAELLGHPIRYDVDAALARQYGGGLHELFVAAMEATVSGLTGARRRTPEAFAVAAPALKTIAFEYGAIGKDTTFDVNTGVVRVVESPKNVSLLSDWDVVEMMDDVFDAAMTDRYGGRAPESVSPAEQRAYVLYVVHHRALPAEGRVAYALDAAARVAALLRLYDHVADASLRAEVRTHLLAEAKSAQGALAGESAQPGAEPVRASFIAWANARAGEWSPADRTAVAELLFTDPQATDRFRRGFDVVRFANPVVAAFAKAGAPPRGSVGGGSNVVLEGESVARLVNLVICPYGGADDKLSASSTSSTGLSSCTGGGALYRDILAASGGSSRLAAWTIEVQNDRFTQAAILNALMAKNTAGAIEVVEALMAVEPAPRVTLVALHALASFTGWRQGRRSSLPPFDIHGLAARVLAWYQARPALRGPLLFLLTQIERGESPPLSWGQLAQQLGAPLTAGEYGAFFDQSPRALTDIDLLTAGLGPGWSRSAVVIPRYQRLLDDPGPRTDDADPHEIADRVFRSFCEDGTLADVGAFVSFIRARLEAYSDRDSLASFNYHSPADACSANSPAVTNSRRGAPPQPVLFGN